jgi:TrmH RNA methyltransferase
MMEEPELLPLSEEDLDEWAETSQIGLILDSVGNDNNLGAIVRSSAFFGVRLIVLSDEDEEARLSTSAYRVAEGGMEHVAFRRVRNVAAFLRDAGSRLVVIGADHRAANRLKELPTLVANRRSRMQADAYAARPNIPVGIAVVLGNEERGLSPDVTAACQLRVCVNGTGAVESLNVAQAATLFLHELYEAQ